MNLKNRLNKLEAATARLRYQHREIIIVCCGISCSFKSGDSLCEHEQKQLDNWIAEHDGKEPDEIIRIIGVPGPGKKEYDEETPPLQ
jgi:hypothetical protein